MKQHQKKKSLSQKRTSKRQMPDMTKRNQKVEKLYRTQTDLPVRSPDIVSTPQVMEKVRSSTMLEFADTLSIRDTLTIDTLNTRKP